MISFLKGNILFRGKDFVVLDVHGVGYRVFVAEKILSTLPKTEGPLTFYTYFHLREETAELYGFLTKQELELFEILNAISGIGPRTALVLSSFGSLDALKKSIEQGKLREIRGLGKKRMQKIILEITGRMQELVLKSANTTNEDEALQGLISLGIPKHKAKNALSRIGDQVVETEQRIKEALRILH